jgi:hypothetical protein
MSTQNERLNTVPVQPIVSTIWEACDDERIEKTRKARDEANRWQSEGDWHGYNFHSGVASGTIEASFIYGQMHRKLEPAMNEMARLLIQLRTAENASEIDAALSAAGYSC